MSKYEPLERFLKAKTSGEVPMRFSEIEAVIGRPLPAAAHTHRAWWSNNPNNNVMTKSWLAAGYVSERVDMASERLVFRRKTASGPGAAPPEALSPKAEPPITNWLADLRGRLAGLVTFVDGVDLTAPSGETWDADR